MNTEGKAKGEEIRQSSPIAYCETTTSNTIFKEDLNRMLLVTTDDGPNLTKRVILTIAARYAPDTGPEGGGSEEAIYDKHRIFQRR